MSQESKKKSKWKLASIFELNENENTHIKNCGILPKKFLDGNLCKYLYKERSESESCSVVSNSLWPMDSPWNSPGQNTGVGSLSLLQEIFPTQESNRGLLHCRRIFLPTELRRKITNQWPQLPFWEARVRRANQTQSNQKTENNKS